MNIKAQGLLNAAKWIEEEYGQSALRDVIRACSVEVRERYTSAIAIEWHPLDEFVELVGEADARLGGGSGKVAEMIGAAGARANMKGLVLRIAFYLAKPEFLMRRVTSLWQQFNDEGALELLFANEDSLALELRGIGDPNALFCAVITGWCREVVAASGAINAVARHVACRAHGQPRCIWEVRYSGLSTEPVSRVPSSRRIPTRPPVSDRIAIDPAPESKAPRSSQTIATRPVSERPKSGR